MRSKSSQTAGKSQLYRGLAYARAVSFQALGVGALAAVVGVPARVGAEITYLGQWGSAGSGDGQFSFEGPSGLDVGPDGTVYIVDPGNRRVERFDASGSYLGQFNAGPSAYLFGLTTTTTGDVYVTDLAQSQVDRFTSNGTFISSFTGPGWSADEQNFPLRIEALSDGTLFVLDTGDDDRGRADVYVQKFTSAGTFLSQLEIGLGNQFAVNSLGDVFTPYGGEIREIDHTGVFGTYALRPNAGAMSVSGNDVLYVADTANQVIRKVPDSISVVPFGNGVGTGPGQFRNIIGLTVGSNGHIYATDSYNERVEHFFDSDSWVSGANTFTYPMVGTGWLLGTSLDLATGKTLNATGYALVSDGTFTMSGGTLSTPLLAVTGPAGQFLYNSGTANVGALELDAGSAILGPGQSMTVAGATIAQGATLGINGGTFNNSGGTTVNGFVGGSGTFAGPFSIGSTGVVSTTANGQLAFSSTAATSNAGTVVADGFIPGGTARVDFAGPLTNATGGRIAGERGASFHFDGGLTNNATLRGVAGQLDVFGNVTNNAAGTIDVASGNITFHGPVVQNGTMNIASFESATFAGTFTGGGGVTGGGNVTFQGQVVPVSGANSYVSLEANATFGASSEFDVSLAGSTSYVPLSINGSTVLGGKLQVSLVGGYQPSLADSFQVIFVNGAATGSFSSYAGMAVGNHLTLHSLPDFGAGGGILSLVARPTLDGDITTDGIVNGQDIAAVASRWLNGYLTTGGNYVNGDVNGDLIVNGQDIATIASHWLQTDGVGGAGSAAVPEPATWLMLLMGTAPLVNFIMRRRAPRAPRCPS